MPFPDIGATVRGLPDLRTALLTIPAKLRRRALRNALAAGARVVRDDARRAAPVLSLAHQQRAPYRRPGTVRNAIAVRTSKLSTRRGDVGVFVNVRPAKKGQGGAKSPTDPYYWRWIEFGTAKMAARTFLAPATRRLADALQVFLAKIGPQITKLNGGKDVQL